MAEAPPEWTTEPKDASVGLDKRITFDYEVRGHPTPKITWFKYIGGRKTLVKASDRHTLSDNGSLVISDVKPDDAGKYECQASNGIGNGLSKLVSLSVHGFSKADELEIKKFQNFASSRESYIKRQETTMKNMNCVERWNDAKVPRSDIRWYNFISLKTCTQANAMCGEMKKYETFFKNLQSTVEELKIAAQENSVDADNVLALYGTLSNLVEEAESGMRTTNSSYCYSLHREFIASQSKIENLIKRVECVALRKQLQQVQAAWKKALDQIDEMRVEMAGLRNDNRELNAKVDGIAAVNQAMAETQNQLLQQNAVMMQMMQEQNTTIADLTRELRGGRGGDRPS